MLLSPIQLDILEALSGRDPQTSEDILGLFPATDTQEVAAAIYDLQRRGEVITKFSVSPPLSVWANSDGARAELRPWSGGSARIHAPGHRIHGTSGPADLQEGWLRSAGFREVA